MDHLVCPQCGKPEVRAQGGLEEATDYFNLLDTQVGDHRRDTPPSYLCFSTLFTPFFGCFVLDSSLLAW